jgi:hypothetical protein
MRVRGLQTSVDVGAAAPKFYSFECRPFLLGRKCRRLVRYAALGLVCCIWDGSVLASARGLGTGVDAGAAASEIFCYECHPLLLWRNRRRFVWCGLGTGVDVGAAAPKLSAWSDVPSSLGESVIGLWGARPRGRCVALSCLVFC